MRILYWFRKDLRTDDNTGLLEATRDGDVVPYYVHGVDTGPSPLRERFLDECLAGLAQDIAGCGSRLVLDEGREEELVLRAARRAGVDAVYWNDEYEPALVARDDAVENALRREGLAVRRFHDRLLVPPGLVRTQSGEPFVVFGPFRRACENLPQGVPLPRATRFAEHDVQGGPAPKRIDLEPLTHEVPRGGEREARRRLESFVEARLAHYASDRDLPARNGTSRLSADLAFGTVSPRAVADAALRAAADTPALAVSAARFVCELRWRDFYAHVLHHFPHAERGAFRPRYDTIAWRSDPERLEAWKKGRTGFPLVDAGMRELATTGFMHNRLRMIVASFLTKDLLIDWRLGESHFRRALVDADLASNNGGWQWAASTGTDSQPWFRIFNPVSQGQRFDPDGDYVRRWVPELAGLPARWIHRPWEAPETVLSEARVAIGRDYPDPIVDHFERREQALAMYRGSR